MLAGCLLSCKTVFIRLAEGATSLLDPAGTEDALFLCLVDGGCKGTLVLCRFCAAGFGVLALLLGPGAGFGVLLLPLVLGPDVFGVPAPASCTSSRCPWWVWRSAPASFAWS